jgi:hypothetical protein
MGKFQEQAADYGVVVRYERDRAARDIGVHFFRKTRSGKEQATGSLVWFQMKGIQAATLSKADFAKARSVAVSLKVKDLQLWYRMNGPTYLAVYIESVDTFLVLNIVAYVAEHYGAKILTLGQKTIDVQVSTKSVLDAQAFDLIVRNGTAEEWARVLGADSGDVHLAQRDYRLLWKLGTSKKRGVEHRMDVKDWQSKLRGEVEFLERPIAGSEDSWRSIREHWQLMLRIQGLEAAYPYLSFQPFDQQHQDDIEFWSNEDDEPFVEFSDGTVVYGHDCAGEYNLYELRPRLNSIGRRLVAIVNTLMRASMIETPDDNEGETLDVAPWHARDV